MTGIEQNFKVGHYARPDVTRLLLNTKPSPPVEYFHLPMIETQPAIFEDKTPEAGGEVTGSSEKETGQDIFC